jgi:hypothetical protein
MVTGLPIFASFILIYRVRLGIIGRKKKKEKMIYNIQYNNVSRYLCDLILTTIQSTTVYPLINGSHIIIPFCKLSITYDSFIPSTIHQWNSLDPSLRNVDSIAKFKTELRNWKNIVGYFTFISKSYCIVNIHGQDI